LVIVVIAGLLFIVADTVFQGLYAGIYDLAS